MLPFLKRFRKEMSKLENVSMSFEPPDFWYSTGNYALNRIMSGSYIKAIPQGRLGALVGPSAAGKSYIICSIIREAQKQGTHCVVLDSENALDPKFMQRIGVDVSEAMMSYLKVVTIQDVTKVISEFLAFYEKEYGRNNKAAPRLMFILDSLGNCLTDSENEKFDKGVQTGDQGQSAKNKKHLLRTLVSRLERFNSCFYFTDQVYPQDPKAGDGLWAVTNGVKYSASQITLLTKLKLKEGTEVIGIMMRAEAYKSRFVKPGTRIELDIPYLTGMSSTTGLEERWLEDKVITKEGYSYLIEVEGKTIKVGKAEMFTDEFVLRAMKTNPRLIEIEKEFALYESNDLFLPETDPEDSVSETINEIKEQLNEID